MTTTSPTHNKSHHHFRNRHNAPPPMSSEEEEDSSSSLSSSSSSSSSFSYSASSSSSWLSVFLSLLWFAGGVSLFVAGAIRWRVVPRALGLEESETHPWDWSSFSQQRYTSPQRHRRKRPSLQRDRESLEQLLDGEFSPSLENLGNEEKPQRQDEQSDSDDSKKLGFPVYSQTAYGRSLGLSLSGLVVAAGSYCATDGRGRVRVYDLWHEDDGELTWTPMGPPIEGEVSGDFFGSSLAVSLDGRTVAVGAHRHNGGGENAGLVQVFQWKHLFPTQQLQDPTQLSPWQIQQQQQQEQGRQSLQYSTQQQQKQQHTSYETQPQWERLGLDLNGLTPAAGNFSAGDWFGHSVSLSGDGRTLAVGAPFASSSGAHRQSNHRADRTSYRSNAKRHTNPQHVAPGQVHVFRYSLMTDSWTEAGPILEGRDTADGFGSTVQLSSDGRVLAVAAQLGPTGTCAGYVQVFQFDTNNKDKTSQWSPLGDSLQVMKGDKRGDHFGISLALSAHGRIVAVGARQDEGGDGRNSVGPGYVKVFEYRDYVGRVLTKRGVAGSAKKLLQQPCQSHGCGVWSQRGQTLRGVARSDRFGISIAMSLDGMDLAVGADGAEGPDNLIGSGHVQVFHYETPMWRPYGPGLHGKTSGIGFGRTVALSADRNVLAVGARIFEGSDSGQIRVFSHSRPIYPPTSNLPVRTPACENGDDEHDMSKAPIDPDSPAILLRRNLSIRVSEALGGARNLRLPCPASVCSLALESTGTVYFKLQGDGRCYTATVEGATVPDNVLGLLRQVQGLDDDGWQCVATNDNQHDNSVPTSRSITFATEPGNMYWLVLGRRAWSSTSDGALVHDPEDHGNVVFTNAPCAAPAGRKRSVCPKSRPLDLSTKLQIRGSTRETPPLSVLNGDPALQCTDLSLQSRVVLYNFHGDGECYSIDTFGSELETLIGLLEGDGCDSLTCRAFSDETDRTRHSNLSFKTEFGMNYWLFVAEKGDESGSYHLGLSRIECPKEPDAESFLHEAACYGARPIVPADILLRTGSTLDAPRIDDASPAMQCAGFMPGFRTVYYKFEGDGKCHTIDTSRGDGDIVLGVLAGSDCESTTCLTSNTRNERNKQQTPQVSFSTEEGNDYWLIVAADPQNDGGFYVLSFMSEDCTTSTVRSLMSENASVHSSFCSTSTVVV